VRAKRRQRLAEAARALTLNQAIDGWLAKAARPNKNAKSDRIRERALRVHFAPLHSRDVGSITVADVAGILRKLAPETAVKSHIAVRAVFDYAITTLEPHDIRMFNPADPRRLHTLGWSPNHAAKASLIPPSTGASCPKSWMSLTAWKTSLRDARCSSPQLRRAPKPRV
jgi:hypothetical protein